MTTSDADDLDYLHARFYNGQLARVLSADRLQGSTHRPQSLNRYAYVLGSPINYVDQALAAGNPVAPASTKPCGCSVKY